MADTRDVAAVAAVTLTEPGHRCALRRHGPEALSYADVAANLTSVLARPVTYVDAPDGAVRQALLGAGPSPPSGPACRSWSWAWGPRWPTCCALMPLLRTGRTAGLQDQPIRGPRPGPRTSPPGTGADRTRSRNMTRTPGPVPRPAPDNPRSGDPAPASAPQRPNLKTHVRRWTRHASSPASSRRPGNRYHGERCAPPAPRAPASR